MEERIDDLIRSLDDAVQSVDIDPSGSITVNEDAGVDAIIKVGAHSEAPAAARAELDSKISRILQRTSPKGSSDRKSRSGVGVEGSCRPTSRSDFLRRLATFRVTNWFGKPHRLRPAICAAAGWESTGSKDALRCTTCKRIACISNPPTGWGASGGSSNSAADSSQQPAIRSAIDTIHHAGHGPKCPWRGAYCPMAFERIRPVPSKRLAYTFLDSTKNVGGLIESLMSKHSGDAARISVPFWDAARGALNHGQIDTVGGLCRRLVAGAGAGTRYAYAHVSGDASALALSNLPGPLGLAVGMVLCGWGLGDELGDAMGLSSTAVRCSDCGAELRCFHLLQQDQGTGRSEGSAGQKRAREQHRPGAGASPSSRPPAERRSGQGAEEPSAKRPRSEDESRAYSGAATGSGSGSAYQAAGSARSSSLAAAGRGTSMDASCMDPRRWHAYGCPWTARASRMLGEHEVKEVLGYERWGVLSAAAAAASDRAPATGAPPLAESSGAAASSTPASGSASGKTGSSAQAQSPPPGRSPTRAPAEVRSYVLAALHTLDKATSRQAGLGYTGLSAGASGSEDDDEQEEGVMGAAGGSVVDGWEVYAQAVGVSVLAFYERGAAEST